MSKLARQYLRAVKVWGVDSEMSMTRKEFTRWRKWSGNQIQKYRQLCSSGQKIITFHPDKGWE